MFINPTERETLLGSAGRSGNRSAESAQTATTELRVVSGIWASAAFGKLTTKSEACGGLQCGSHSLGASAPRAAGLLPIAIAMPPMKSRSAAGSLRLWVVDRTSRVARAAVIR